MNRRKFIEKSGVAAGAAMLGNVARADDAGKPEQTSRPDLSDKIKLGLYSISYGGVWYQGPALSFDQMCRKGK